MDKLLREKERFFSAIDLSSNEHFSNLPESHSAGACTDLKQEKFN